jgi:DNA-binding NtrC family response regulator
MDPAILYVDDEQPNLDVFVRAFEDDEDNPLRILTARSGAEALEILKREDVGVLVTDQRMPAMSGVELLERARAEWPEVSRVLLTAYSDRELLVSAIQRGHVHDYVLKPWDSPDLALRLHNALLAHRRRRELAGAEIERDALRREVDERGAFGELVGQGGGLRKLSQQIEKVARTDATVLVFGESGTGKELIARELHRRSLRKDRPFIRTNCAVFSPGVLESELFGHEAGSFTGARTARPGRFEQAHGGTLLLDEIGDVPLDVQVKLLRVLQEREVERVGSNRVIRVDIRVIAATHRNLDELVKKGQFREDLFYRLNVVPLQVPPLRDRPEDIEPLARYFVDLFGRQMGKALRLASDAIAALRAYDWPGNVRELRNVIERAVVLGDEGAELGRDDFLFDFWGADARRSDPPPAGSVFEEVAQAEAERIRDALRRAGGNKVRAARLLGIPRTTLNDRIRRLDIR